MTVDLELVVGWVIALIWTIVHQDSLRSEKNFRSEKPTMHSNGTPMSERNCLSDDDRARAKKSEFAFLRHASALVPNNRMGMAECWSQRTQLSVKCNRQIFADLFVPDCGLNWGGGRQTPGGITSKC